jgi:hypothetical protein
MVNINIPEWNKGLNVHENAEWMEGVTTAIHMKGEPSSII